VRIGSVFAGCDAPHRKATAIRIADVRVIFDVGQRNLRHRCSEMQSDVKANTASDRSSCFARDPVARRIIENEREARLNAIYDIILRSSSASSMMRFGRFSLGSKSSTIAK